MTRGSWASRAGGIIFRDRTTSFRCCCAPTSSALSLSLISLALSLSLARSLLSRSSSSSLSRSCFRSCPLSFSSSLSLALSRSREVLLRAHFHLSESDESGEHNTAWVALDYLKELEEEKVTDMLQQFVDVSFLTFKYDFAVAQPAYA